VLQVVMWTLYLVPVLVLYFMPQRAARPAAVSDADIPVPKAGREA
jgi:hypothetical protein